MGREKGTRQIVSFVRAPRPPAAFLFCAALSLALTAFPLPAANYTVNSLLDTRPTLGGAGSGAAGDLRYCVTQANFGAGGPVNTITFAVKGTITLAGHELVINSDLTIAGPGKSSLTVSGNNASRLVYITPGRTVTISDLTLTKGNGVGNDPTGLDTSSTFAEYGGAIYNDRGTLTLTDCALTANVGDEGGGAIYNNATRGNATLSVNNCSITGNSGFYGGGIYNFASEGVATLNVAGTTIRGNTARGAGGGIRSFGPANSTLSQCDISGNTANFLSSSEGGGIYNSHGTMSLDACVISGNASVGGGGIANTNGLGATAMTMTNCTVSGNTATETGAGIYSYAQFGSATLLLNKCAVYKNQAGISGGGVVNATTFGAATLTAGNCTVSGNSAVQRGGGLYNSAENSSSRAMASLANCTVSGNSALSGGGGIANDRPQSAENAVASVTFANSLVALNSTGANYNSTFGVGVSDGFNLSDDATCAAFFTAAGDKNGVGAGLQVDAAGKPLIQANGGPTWTVALLPASMAIDAGRAAADPQTQEPATTDQRGSARPFDQSAVTDAAEGDGSDIGAFESDGSPLTTPTPTPAPTPAPKPPTIAIGGKKNPLVKKASLKITGSTTGSVTSVTYRLGPGGTYRKLADKTPRRWSVTVHLKRGKNVFSAIAKGPGGSSRPAKITITYRPKK